MLPDLTQYLWIVWLVLALIFVIVELLTLEFTFLMLAGGTLVGGLGSNLLSAPWWLQVAAAAAVSALLLFTIRPLLLRALHRSSRHIPTNVDALHGIGARVLVPFVDGAGSVKLDNGETWTARFVGPDTGVEVGTRLVVRAVRGATVEVAVVPAPDPKENTHG
ncbi:MAG: NfeD family protein [Microbacterium arborescens]